MEMRRKILILLLLVALVAAAKDSGNSSGKDSDLKCSKKTIAELGKDVTLDCYCEPRCDVTSEELKWKFNQKTYVLAVRIKSDPLKGYLVIRQDSQFEGRANVSSTESLKDGNFSVKISKINESDEGNYTCNVESETFHVGRKTCSVELKVNKTAEEDEKTRDGPKPGTISGIVVGVLLLLVGAVIAWLIYRNRKSLLSSEGTQKPSQESIDLTSTTKNEEGTPSEVNPLTAPS